MPNSQITVRARDCVDQARRPMLIGDVLGYKDRQWLVVGIFMGADPMTSEVEEYLVLEGWTTEGLAERERGEQRARIL